MGRAIWILVGITFSTALGTAQTAPATVRHAASDRDVSVDPRLSWSASSSTWRESRIQSPLVPSYAQDVERQFGNLKDHAMVA